MARAKTRPTTARSPKAGRPPREGATPPRVRRRQKTAKAAFRKDTTIMQAAEGPRAAWAATKPNVKKG
jgi:transposase-like protein